jgi:hypothetical protein
MNVKVVEVPGHNLRVLRLDVSVYNVYITNQFQTTFARVWGGVNPLVEVTVNTKKKKKH